jgi:hypothetical protein
MKERAALTGGPSSVRVTRTSFRVVVAVTH